MKKYSSLLLSLLAAMFIIGGFSITAKAQTVDSGYMDGIIYTKVADGIPLELAPYDFSEPALNLLYTTYNIDSIIQPFPGLNGTLDKTYRVYFSNILQVDAFVSAMDALPFIEYAEKAPLYYTGQTPNDLDAAQWHLPKINALLAWDITTGSEDIVVAVVDNAVRITHNDLAPNIWQNDGEIGGLPGIDDDFNGFVDDFNGWDASDNDNNPNPPPVADESAFSHGTHCAGIVSAATDNNMGIASIGYNVSIMGVKCSPNSSASEGRSLPNAYDGVFYATRAGADVISMSWGGSGNSVTGQNLLKAAHDAGIVLVGAAGNDDVSTPFYPGSDPRVINVGATNELDQKSWFSNYGSTVDVMAPGSNIYSTVAGSDDSYGFLNGTSMACPLVAGLCALILSDDPSKTPAQVKTMLLDGCTSIDATNPGYAGQLGAGRIDAFVTLGGYVGIEDGQFTSSEISIYPNPSNGQFHIRGLENHPGPAKIQIFATNGQLIFENEDFDMQDAAYISLAPQIASGMYMAKIEVADEQFRSTVIINK